MTKTTQAQAKPKAKKTTKATPSKRKPGRPSSYTQAAADRICDRIATSTDSLRKICDGDDLLPTVETIRMWCWKRPEFAAQYARAKQQQAELQAEELLTIADDGSNDTYVDDDGRAKVDNDVIARSRLRVDTRKWLMSKLAPKKFGEKVDVNHGGQAENPLAVLFSQVAGTPYKPESND